MVRLYMRNGRPETDSSCEFVENFKEKTAVPAFQRGSEEGERSIFC